jgi:hypothetical protein
MFAYILLVLAVFSRVLPHDGWFGFTAVTGSLLFFGARRPLREGLLPVVALMALDGYLTVFQYGYSLHLVTYLPTWAWYFAMIWLGSALLKDATVLRAAAAVLAGPTSFFLVSNFTFWAAEAYYAKTFAGLMTCFAAGIPFYQKDLVSTAVVIAVAFGLPALIHYKTPVLAPAKAPRR